MVLRDKHACVRAFIFHGDTFFISNFDLNMKQYGDERLFFHQQLRLKQESFWGRSFILIEFLTHSFVNRVEKSKSGVASSSCGSASLILIIVDLVSISLAVPKAVKL